MKFYGVFVLLVFTLSVHAQHKISAYGGWTASKLQVYFNPNVPTGTNSEVFDFSFLHSPYVAMEYEYDWKKLRLSTGLSMTCLGTGRFWGEDQPWAGIYLNIPVIAGIKWNLPKNWSLTIETGIEAGLKLSAMGVVFVDDIDGIVNGVPQKKKVQGNINSILGLEANWKKFRFGARLQVGLTDFKVWNDDATMKHLALTTYIGCTLWDSKLAKERKAKRLAKKQATAG